MGNDLRQYNVLTVRRIEQARNGLGHSLPTRIEILDYKPSILDDKPRAPQLQPACAAGAGTMNAGRCVAVHSAAWGRRQTAV